MSSKLWLKEYHFVAYLDVQNTTKYRCPFLKTEFEFTLQAVVQGRYVQLSLKSVWISAALKNAEEKLKKQGWV